MSCLRSACDDLAGHVARLLAPRVGEQEDVAVAARGSVTAPPSHQDPPGPGAGHLGRDASGADARAPRRSQRKNSTLPAGPGSGLVVHGHRAPATSAAAAATTFATASARSAEVADHAALAEPVLADLELRLHHQRQVAVGRGHAEQGVEHQLEGDEGQVAHDQVHRTADQLRRHAPGRWSGRGRAPGRPAAATRPAGRSRRRPPPPRAAPARSSTSVNPPVEAPASRQRRPDDAQALRPRSRQRAGQLVAAARDVVGTVRVVAHHDVRVGGHAGGRLGGRAAVDGHPAGGDQLGGVLTRARQPAPHQLGVEPEPPWRHGSALARLAGGSPVGRLAAAVERAPQRVVRALEHRDVLVHRQVLERLERRQDRVDRGVTGRSASPASGSRTGRRAGRSSSSGVSRGSPRPARPWRSRYPAARVGTRSPRCRPGRPARRGASQARPATTRHQSPGLAVAVDLQRVRPSTWAVQPPSRRTRAVHRRGPGGPRPGPPGRRRGTSAARGVAAASSSSPVTPVSTSRLSQPVLCGALDVGVQPVADHERAVAADPPQRLLEQRRLRLARDHGLDAGRTPRPGAPALRCPGPSPWPSGSSGRCCDATHGSPVVHQDRPVDDLPPRHVRAVALDHRDRLVLGSGHRLQATLAQRLVAAPRRR